MSSDTGCGFYGGCAPSLTLDPHKRVHYSTGLVLGVDEFVQAEYYFLEGMRRHHRMLHGYGTVCGLGVSLRDVTDGVEVRVEPGHAIDMHGRELRISAAQCARLDDWLGREAEVSPLIEPGSPPEMALWVVLCYRECLTDLEPIPGTPCRTPEELMTPTRVTESFSLRLERDPPDMVALDGIRAFARLIGRLYPGPVAEPDISIAALEAEVAAIGTPAEPPDPSPPALPEEEPIRIPEALMRDYLSAAFRTWVTIVRPALVPVGRSCADGPGDDGCIALARLRVPLAEGEAGLGVDGGAGAVAVEDADRPLLLSTQLLQEFLVNGGATGAGGARVHEELEGLEADDHPQYLLIEPRSPASSPPQIDRLVNNLSGQEQFRLRELPDAAQAGDAMPAGQPAGGDLSGSLPDPNVVGLHGLPVQVPANGDRGRLLGVGAQDGRPVWQLVDPPSFDPAVGGDLSGSLPDPNVVGLHGFDLQQPTLADVGRHLAVGTQGGSPVWQLVDPPTGGGVAGETDLVRLLALSWVHNAASDLSFRLLNDRDAVGLAIAFGMHEVGDAWVLLGIEPESSRIDLGSLDEHSFRVYAEIQDQRFPSSTRLRLRLMPINLIPIAPQIEPGQTFFTEAQAMEGTAAPGAFLELDPETRNFLFAEQALIWIEIDGDHVLAHSDGNEQRRAVDIEFLRSRLPSGDRPDGAERGTQGGLFSSWINRANREGLRGGRLDLNRADITALRAIGISATGARRVVAARESSGGFASLEDLHNVSGLSAAVRTRLADTNRIYLGPR